MEDLIMLLRQNLFITIIGAITIIQIVPIKINPWSAIGRAVKSWLLGDLEKEVKRIGKDLIDEKVSNKRWLILDFANSCRQNVKHTKEEWDHCLSELKWYEEYCETNKIQNGVIEECGKYLRELYRERLDKNDFL